MRRIFIITFLMILAAGLLAACETAGSARDLGSLPNQMWLYNCGPQWAKRLLMTGDTVTGAEAAFGLVEDGFEITHRVLFSNRPAIHTCRKMIADIFDR